MITAPHRYLPALFLTLLIALLMPADARARASVTGLRLGSHPGGITRVVFDISEAIDFNTALYADPYRVVVNTPALIWGQGARGAKLYGAVHDLRYDEDSLGGRIMLDLREPATVKSAYVIPPRDNQGWRLVLDLQTVSRAVFLGDAATTRSLAQSPAQQQYPASPPPAALPPPPPARPATTAQAAPQPVQQSQPQPAQQTFSPPPQPASEQPASESASQASYSYTPVTQRDSQPTPAAKTGGPVMSAPVPPPVTQSSARTETAALSTKAAMAPAPAVESRPKALPSDGKPVVVIDPGHGGVDPGAIGVSGIYEKYITLAMARELKSQLEKQGRYKVRLTRDRDIFIRLRDRTAIARQYNADLFISLHADSVGNPQLKGLSIYTLSQNASDAEAQALADKENKADLLAGIDLSHESADVANILIDLAQRETMNRSAGFAGGVVEEMGRETSLLANSHRFAGFAVLKAPDVPAVLIEMGYLSNETEEHNLRQPEYRQKLAKGIARAVDRFFVEGQKARRP